MSEISVFDETLIGLSADRWLAHQLFFPHRHPIESAPAHHDMVDKIYGRNPRLLVEGFRGIAKSTHLEETAVIKAAFREFNNMVIVGASYERACERLAAVKREIEQNETLALFFGTLKGSTWQEGKIVLATGVCIQALGRNQSTVGIKHFDWRPDAVLVDDVEDPEEKRTDLEREEVWVWFLRTLLPSLDHPLTSWVRVLGTRRGVGSLPERLEKDGWPTVKYPIEYLDHEGKRRATWPAKFPLADIDQMKKSYRGNMDTWEQEYMCRAVSQTDRTFTREMLVVDPRVRTWQAVYAMYDPARTAHRGSATTGKAVWSWIGQRLVFWRIAAETWLPDEIIDDIFATEREFHPTWIGFEKTGLNEWAMQPIRHESARRRIVLPLKGVEAPRGKLDFIRGLQPFGSNRELIFAEPLSEDVAGQFLSFPTGKIDAPNAAAYALLMRPGAPMFDNFGDDNIVEDLGVQPGRPVFLAANATGGMVTAVLMQAFDGQLRLLADWVREGAPGNVVPDIHMEAAIEGDTSREVIERVRPENLSDMLKLPEHRVTLARMPVKWVVPPRHNERWNNVGLVQAIKAVPASVQTGGQEDVGRTYLAGSFSRLSRGGSASVLVSDRASWTLNAFAGGYARAVVKGIGLADHAEEGPYRLLMEGVESFAAMLASARLGDEDGDSAQNIGYSRDGTPYKSAMPGRR